MPRAMRDVSSLDTTGMTAYGGSIRVLVVEDERDTLMTLGILLRSEGYDVRLAHGGDEVPAAVHEFKPHAVLLDIGMPGRDGYSLMNELRSSPGLMPRVAVALSAYAAPRDREQSELAGFQEHLAKPIDPATLVRILHDRLGDAARNQASS